MQNSGQAEVENKLRRQLGIALSEAWELKDENIRLRAALDEKKEEVIQLQEKLKENIAPTSLLPKDRQFTPTEEKLLRALLWQDECANEYLFNLLYGSRDEQPKEKIIGVYIGKLRIKLKHRGMSIENIYGWGYRLRDRRKWLAELKREAGDEY